MAWTKSSRVKAAETRRANQIRRSNQMVAAQPVKQQMVAALEQPRPFVANGLRISVKQGAQVTMRIGGIDLTVVGE